MNKGIKTLKNSNSQMDAKDIIAFQKKLRKAERAHNRAKQDVEILSSALTKAISISKLTGDNLEKVYQQGLKLNIS